MPCFNEAAAYSRGKLTTPSTRCSPAPCFNEAAAYSRGKPHGQPGNRPSLDPASMRPRHIAAENDLPAALHDRRDGASMRPRHIAAENNAGARDTDTTCAGFNEAAAYSRGKLDSCNSPRLQVKRPGVRGLHRLVRSTRGSWVRSYILSVKERFGNKELVCFERCRDISHQPSARCTAASGACITSFLSVPVRQTMMGSRATASKRLPRLSTLGVTLSAGPKSTIRM